MDYISIYADFLKNFLKPQRKLKAVFDCSNGTAGIVLKNLKTEKLKTILINQIPDGDFSAHGPNPLKPGALKQLQNEVKKQKADVGIIFDADGDRVFFIDNLGRFINPDAIALLLIWQLKPKKTVIDVRTGWLVKKGIMNNELEIGNGKSSKKSMIHNSRFIIHESRVGHYFIKKLMRKIKACFGAEYSGHYYFKSRDSKQQTRLSAAKKTNCFYFDSGILSAIETINAISKLPYRLSDFVDLLPQYFRSGELNFKTKNPQKTLKETERKIKARYSPLITNIARLDGLTMEFKKQSASRSFGEDWWFNLRLSNTESLVRLNIEAISQKLLNQKIKELRKLIINKNS